VREVNERIEQIDQAAARAGDPTTVEFLCECGSGDGDDIACDAQVEMTLEEYEEVRLQDDRFVLVPGHENAAIEQVVKRTDRFIVVDKRPDAEPFVDDDPRGAPST